MGVRHTIQPTVATLNIHLLKSPGLYLLEISSISTPEQVLVGFFLVSPVLIKKCSEQPYGAMVLKVYVSVLCTLMPFEGTPCT